MDRHIPIVCLTLLFTISLTPHVFGYGDGASSSGNLTKVTFTPNPSVPEFANAKGTLLINLTEGAFNSLIFKGFLSI